MRAHRHRHHTTLAVVTVLLLVGFVESNSQVGFTISSNIGFPTLNGLYGCMPAAFSGGPNSSSLAALHLADPPDLCDDEGKSSILVLLVRLHSTS